MRGCRQEAGVEEFNNRRLQEMVDLAVANQVNREERIRKLTISRLAISPLADEVKNHVIPANFKQPPFEQYDEINGCPVQHVIHYLSIMAIWDHDDRLLTKMFSASLKGEAQTWYHSLPPGSIHSFVQLAELFEEKYRFNEKPKKGADALFTLQMERTESLRNFVKRFRSMLSEIQGGNDNVVVQAFKHALNSNQEELYRSLARKPPATVSALLEKAERYAQEEDDLKARKKRLAGGQSSDKAQKEKDSGSTRDQKEDRAPDKGKDSLRINQEAFLSPLRLSDLINLTFLLISMKQLFST